MFFFQAEDGIRDLVRSRGLGDVYKRQDGHLSAALRQDEYERFTLRVQHRGVVERGLLQRLSLIHI